MSLMSVLRKKNPYLFKAKNIETVGDLVKSILESSISSSEETMFGNLLESFAIYVSQVNDRGFKSRLKSIDLEFERDEVYYIVGIKSGTNWGNRDQIDKMKENFKFHRLQLIRESKAKSVVAVNGCMYGRDGRPHKVTAEDDEKTYFKYAGQEFWEFLSGDADLYLKIIVPIGREARERDEVFKAIYVKKINEMTENFVKNFMTNSEIDWEKLLEFVSKKPLVRLTTSKKSRKKILESDLAPNSLFERFETY
jgi:hypothetical protein